MTLNASQRDSLTAAAEKYNGHVEQAATYLEERGLWDEELLAHLVTFRPTQDAERFVAKVSPGSGGCLLWTGTRDKNGYGKFWFDGELRRAGHFVLSDRPSAQHVMRHACDHPPCVSPGHLCWGTKSENTQDMIARGRARWGRKPVLSAAQRSEAIGRHKNGESINSIARSYGVSWMTVGRAVGGHEYVNG